MKLEQERGSYNYNTEYLQEPMVIGHHYLNMEDLVFTKICLQDLIISYKIGIRQLRFLKIPIIASALYGEF